MRSSLFQRYLLSAFVFKSALIGGGYVTGRELVEFFLSRGPWAGFGGIVVASAVFSITLAITFELARRYALFDYRSFFKMLLGRAWVGFEAAYLALMVLVLAVLGAASAEIVTQATGWPGILGTFALMALIATVVFYGTSAIERFFTWWGFILYGAFVLFFAWSTVALGEDIVAGWRASPPARGSVLSGFVYAGYSLSVIPSILYCARHFSSRRDAIVSGVLAGPIAMVPAALFYLVMVARYPQVNEQPVPILYMLSELNIGWFDAAFQVIIFGTMVEAGTALIHGYNERVADALKEKGRSLPSWGRTAIALALMSVSIFLAASIGIVDLIGKGYGYSTYVFLLILGVPLLTRGVWLIFRDAPRDDGSADNVVRSRG